MLSYCGKASYVVGRIAYVMAYAANIRGFYSGDISILITSSCWRFNKRTLFMADKKKIRIIIIVVSRQTNYFPTAMIK